jgi:hypothetical protein
MGTGTPELLEYSPVEMTLRRPWYVWAGAAIASLWVSAAGVAAGVGIVVAALERNSEPLVTIFIISLYSLVVLLCMMLLGLEWRAVFRYSATASGTLGIVLVLPAGLAAIAEMQAVRMAHAHAVSSPDVWLLGTVATSLGFACFTHFRWTSVIARWLTRTA